MKNYWVLVVSTLATACAGMPDSRTDQARNHTNPDQDIPWTSPGITPAPDLNTAPNNLPQQILPASGGPPVIAIPIGGNLYLPVTGGEPIVGTPLFP